jgi:Tfp pilus assembly protein PilX
MTMRTLRNEKGVSLIMAVATLLIFSLMALVVVFGN